MKALIRRLHLFTTVANRLQPFATVYKRLQSAIGALRRHPKAFVGAFVGEWIVDAFVGDWILATPALR